ncbi:hypothetical protein I4U23_010314 [Adineta vaga]|nr:hypothetical protein I4U23_010314 [Adineta vaga]
MSTDIILKIKCNLKSFYCKRRFPISQWTLGDFRLYIEQLLDISIDNLIILLHSHELMKDQDQTRLCNIVHDSSELIKKEVEVEKLHFMLEDAIET